MSVRAFVEQLSSVGASRMVKLVTDRIVSDYYVLVGPDVDHDGNTRHAAIANRAAWHDVDMISPAFVPRWGWYVNTGDQAADLARIQDLDFELQPSGWCLDIEKASEGAKLETLIAGVHALGKPIVASLGGFQSASHGSLDYRTLDKYGVACEWQAYFDSGEGVTPAHAVQELYASTFVIPGWEYRARLGSVYGWGQVARIGAGQVAHFSAYRKPRYEATFIVADREWGHTVVARELFRNGQEVGRLMGRAAYQNIRVALDVTRTAQARKPEEWTPIAASARVPGAAKRGVSVYLLDNCSDEVLKAIAGGAGP